uniref:Uncharacterized protein n=1 Tax=Arundo donax TaxID=35708 RepID=A0A0A9FPZ6_ARUDO
MSMNTTANRMEMADVYLNESTRFRSTRGSRTAAAATSTTSRLVHQCRPNHSGSTPACASPPLAAPEITSPMMMRYTVRVPKALNATNTLSNAAPARPNASPISDAYDGAPRVYRSMKSTAALARTATPAIRTTAGATPRTRMAAGIDMIPAPTTLVDTLNTAPSTDAEPPPAAPACSGSSGASADLTSLTLRPPPPAAEEAGGFLDTMVGCERGVKETEQFGACVFVFDSAARERVKIARKRPERR